MGDNTKLEPIPEVKTIDVQPVEISESFLSTTKRHRYEFDRAPVGHDLGWVCWDGSKYSAGDEGAVFGYGLTQDHAYADLMSQLDDAKPRAGRVIHSSPFQPPEVIDDRDTDFDDDLEPRE